MIYLIKRIESIENALPNGKIKNVLIFYYRKRFIKLVIDEKINFIAIKCETRSIFLLEHVTLSAERKCEEKVMNLAQGEKKKEKFIASL